MEVSGQPQVPVVVPHKTALLDPLNRKVGGSRTRSGCFKINPCTMPGFETRNVQSSCYPDYASYQTTTNMNSRTSKNKKEKKQYINNNNNNNNNNNT